MSKDIETEFRKTVKTHGSEIDEAVNRAQKAIREAVELAEKYGIPFEGPAGNYSDTYVPKSMPKLDLESIEEITGIYARGEYGGYPGWQTSHC